MPGINFTSSTFEKKPANTVMVLSPNIIKQGDQMHDLRIQLLRGDVPVDLLGKTVFWSAASSKGKFITDREAQVFSNGEVTLSFNEEDAGAHGELRVELKVIHEDGKVEKFPANDFARFTITLSLDDLSKTPVYFASVEFFEQKVNQAENAAEDAKQSAASAEQRAIYVEQQGDVAEAQGLFAQAKATEARDQAALAKQVAEENKTNWKQEVATVALRNSTYPNPQIGDTVRITGEARIDRFNGTEWITTDRYNPAVVDEITGKLADTTQVFRWQEGTPGSAIGLEAISVNVGYKGNGIADGIRGAFVSQGSQNNENIAGGFLDKVGLIEPNLVDPNSKSAHYTSIQGYDNVVNALAAVVNAFHVKVHSAATHPTVLGGSYHEVKDGDYSAILGGTESLIDIVGTINGSGYGFIATSVRSKAYGPFALLLSCFESTVRGDFGSSLASKWSESNGQFSTNIGAVSSKANGNTSFNIGTNTSEANGSGSGNFGSKNTINNGQNSLTFATENALMEANNAYLFGKGGRAKNSTQFSIAGGMFGDIKGSKQKDLLVLSRQTTDRTYQTLGIDGTSVAPTIEPGFTWSFKGEVTARSGDSVKTWTVNGTFSRTRAGVTEFLGTPTITEKFAHSDTATWSVSFLAGTGTFNLRGLGEAGKTISWLATLEIAQLGVAVA